METFRHNESGREFREGAPFTLNGVKYPRKWLSLSTKQERAALGLERILKDQPIAELTKTSPDRKSIWQRVKGIFKKNKTG